MQRFRVVYHGISHEKLMIFNLFIPVNDTNFREQMLGGE